MPLLPVTATLLQSSPNGYRSRLLNTPLSSATGSIDTLTVAHQLGTVDEVRVVTRSIVTAGLSGAYVSPVVLSYNCSQAVITLPLANGAAAQNGLYDVIVEHTHTMVR